VAGGQALPTIAVSQQLHSRRAEATLPTFAPQLWNAKGECAKALIESGVNPSVDTTILMVLASYKTPLTAWAFALQHDRHNGQGGIVGHAEGRSVGADVVGGDG
jgi:hypothetical protein